MNSQFELIVLQERVADMTRFAERHRVARSARGAVRDPKRVRRRWRFSPSTARMTEVAQHGVTEKRAP
jgi:hypothetical protein